MKKIFTLCLVLCMSYLSMGATNLKHEFRATWLTTAWGNDWPKIKVTNDATRKQQQDSLIAIFDRLQAGNMNAVCLQVRGRSDAFYQSSYEPWAAELAGARGTDPGYDPLAFAIEEAHKRGLELHAWVNPFRVTSAGTLASTDLVKKNAGQWIIQYNNGSFTGEIIDPGYPEAREYVLNVLMEIINNYDIDGIVMDDYFYPYGGTTTEDAASKALHKPANVVDVNQDGDTDDDWRRSNVDVFLEELYDRIQTKKPWVRFGMGTFGIWTTQSKVAQAYGISLPSGISGLDDYDEQACNPVEWVKNGYVDYINPQLYWPTTSTGQNYNKLCQWWAKDVCEHFSNQLTNGKKVHFFSSQSISSNSAVSEIQAEIDANRNNLSSGSTGSVFFDTDAYLTMDKDLMTSRFATNALTPPMDWKSNTALAAPTNLTVSGSTLTWQHATAERFTVYVYPKGTAWSTAKNDPAYLQGVIYGNSLDISGIDTNMNDIAVCAYDRFGVEHETAIYGATPDDVTPPASGTITYELNGGVTNEYGWMSKDDMYHDLLVDINAIIPTTRVDVDTVTLAYDKTKNIQKGIPTYWDDLSSLLTHSDFLSKWGWLINYMDSACAPESKYLPSTFSVYLRYNLSAFFFEKEYTSWPQTPDYSKYGLYPYYQPAWQHAYDNPTNPTEEFILNAPYREGYTFAGWYTNADLSGEKVTTINSETTGTLYAKWIESDHIITYTSTDGNIVTPYATDVFGANIVSNTYEDGQGVITFDGPVTCIGNLAFSWCHSLASITIPNSVTSIGDEAFGSCDSLACIILPNSVMSIGERAFNGCYSITSFTIPHSVTSIGNDAFGVCTSLASITIPESVTSIGESVFQYCYSLTSIHVEQGNTIYDSRNNCNAIIETETNTLIAGCQSTIIPNSVTSIGNSAFRHCIFLVSITIPESVTSIGNSAFEGCYDLTSIIIPNSVTSIGDATFHQCYDLTSITLPNSVTSIGKSAFARCSSLTSVSIPSGVTSIEESTFSNCSSLASIIIPNSVTSIGGGAFDYCSSLTAITIPDGVTSIEGSTFSNCSSLTSVTIPNSVTSIGDFAFSYCSSLASITIPKSVTSIGNSAFSSCWMLTSITIPERVTSIEWGAFSHCDSLNTIHIEATTPPIVGDYAFTHSPTCHIPCGTLAAYQVSDWAQYVSEFEEEGCAPKVTYELNGGVTNDYGWQSKGAVALELQNDYNAAYGTSKEWAKSENGYIYYKLGEEWVREDLVPAGTDCTTAGFIAYVTYNNSDNLKNLFAANPDKYGWLNDIIIATRTAAGLSVDDASMAEIIYRYELSAFFLCSPERTSWPGTSSYEVAGTFESFKTIWKQAFANPTNPTEEFILNAPYREGYTFAGWYTTPDFSGEKVTTVNSETTGTLYAKWIDETWQITYTSTDGNIVTPYATDVFGANIVSNIYENGVGTITFDGPVTSIGYQAFRWCESLTSITIPNSVTSLGKAAFFFCRFLTSITIPNNVTSIGIWAFASCSSLTSITIPNGVTSIGESAFSYCTSLTSMVVEPGNTTYDSRENCNAIIETATNTLVAGCQNTTIPNSVTSIGIWAFDGCTSLTSITIPNSVTSIGKWAFDGCTSLTSMVVEPGNTTYDSRENCNAIIETVTNTLVAGCQNTTIPNSVTSIGSAAFFGCDSLTSITIPNSVTSIGLQAFDGCPSLTSITCEATTPPTLGSSVFPSNLTTAYIPCGTKEAYEASDWANYMGEFVEDCVEGQQIFYTSTDGNIVTPCKTNVFGANIVSNTYENGVGTITFDGAVTCIGDSAFNSCDGLISVTIPESVTSIGSSAFRDCSGLTSVTIPNSVTSIGGRAFFGCSSLSSINIPDGVTSIREYAFSVCSSLTSITIPNSLTSIKGYAFSDCSSLTSIVVDGGNTTYDSRENCNAIIETATNTLITGCQNTIIPNSVTSIGGGAFYDCSSLTSITIPNSVTSIGNFAFSNCSSLTSITIPNSVTSIGVYAFSDCSSLTSITIPNSVTSIKIYAFYKCSSLTSITIPNSVTSIKIYAFYKCSSLTSITIPNSMTSIGSSAFRDCSGLTSVTIPNSVTSFGHNAFRDCSSLDTIRIEATTPPALEEEVFDNTPASICYIPCGTLAAYEVSDWANYMGEFVEEGCAPIQMCGDDLYWEYADGVLTITGTGDMYDYAADTDVPWYDVRGNIKTINMPDEMTKIGDYAFYKCTAMTTINMPTSLTAIGEKAFAQDTKLACEIILPASMTTIASRAFFNCQAVTAFHIEATTPPTIPNDAFERTTAPIHVPCGYGHVYGKHTQWGVLNLEMCELLQDNVYYYPIDGHTARAVTYHSNPTDTIVIPSAVVIDGMPRTVTEVADFAFTDCKDIPAIIFNEGLEYIGERAFVRCYGLQGTIVLPATLETIGERAFSYCDNVEKYLIQAMTPPALGDGAFTCANHDALFYVSCEVMDDYKVAARWSSLKSRLRDACLNIYHYNTPLGTNGVYTTEDTLVASIYYRRQFTPYRWETLYLPFEVDRVTVLEEGVEYDLTAWDIVDGGHYFLAKPDGMLNKEILFGFTDELASHTPYIIQFSDAYYTDKLITFYGKESWNKLSTSFEVLSSSAWMQIAGNTTMQDQLLEKPVYMLRSGLDFILQKTTTTLHPFECYVMPYATPSGTPARMNVRFRGDVPTAVESVKGNESHLTYTVDGYTLTVYPQGQAFSIYSLNGALIYSCEAGKEAVDCELNSGCYLLHAGTEAHKIML